MLRQLSRGLVVTILGMVSMRRPFLPVTKDREFFVYGCDHFGCGKYAATIFAGLQRTKNFYRRWLLDYVLGNPTLFGLL